jgi:hypothetical protein
MAAEWFANYPRHYKLKPDDTGAEEAAFIGAMAGCDLLCRGPYGRGGAAGTAATRQRQRGALPKRALIVAIETSAAQPAAKLGDGVIVRVGDRVRTFDIELTAHVSAVAERLAKRDRTFRHSRQLMPGGTCESSAYAVWGYTATGLCIPLGNYHNQGRGRIEPERIDLDDFANLVKLLVALAADKTTPADTAAAFRRRLNELLRTRGPWLCRPVQDA